MPLHVLSMRTKQIECGKGSCSSDGGRRAEVFKSGPLTQSAYHGRGVSPAAATSQGLSHNNMYRTSQIPSAIPPALLPSNDCPPSLAHCGYNRLPPSRIEHNSVPQTDTSRLSVIFYTLRKVAFKWPLWLQMAMTKAVIDGLPLGFSYGCAQGTIVAVDEGYTHIAADVSCTLVGLYCRNRVSAFKVPASSIMGPWGWALVYGMWCMLHSIL